MTDRELMQQALEALEILTDGYDETAVGVEIEAITALRKRLELDEKLQYDADHVVLEKITNDCVCTHCGQRYHIHMPVPVSIMTAIVDAFLEAHHQCEKPEHGIGEKPDAA